MSPSQSCETLADDLGGIAHRGFAENQIDLDTIVDLTFQNFGE